MLFNNTKGHARSQTVVYSICQLVMIAAERPMQTCLSDLVFFVAVALSICTDGFLSAPAYLLLFLCFARVTIVFPKT